MGLDASCAPVTVTYFIIRKEGNHESVCDFLHYNYGGICVLPIAGAVLVLANLCPHIYKPPTKEQRNKWLSELPENVILSAPYTPYKDDELRSLNATEDNVYRLASNAKRLGVNLVWVPRSMGQFQALTVDERETLAKALGEGWKGTWDIRCRPRRQQLRPKV